jgi:hypothetical protein
MKLYIQTINGQYINHPAFEDNLIAAFGSVPIDWVPFARISQPTNDILPVGPYQTAKVTYVQDGDGWKDSWDVEDITTEEKNNLIAYAMLNQPYPSWTFDEPTCSWLPPTPKPNGFYWEWNEETLSWKDTTPPPLTLSDVSFI